MTTIKLTDTDVANCTWQVVGIDGDYRISIGRGTHPVTGVPIEVMRKEFLADERLQLLNTEERNARDSKRWSDGTGSDRAGNVPMVRVARTPLAKFFDEVAPRMQQGDKDHLKWWLRQDQNQPFRTKSGSI